MEGSRFLICYLFWLEINGVASREILCGKILRHIIVATAAVHIISKHFIPAEFILLTDTALTNNMHHPNIIIQLFAHNNIISVEACLILSLTYKLHTEMIHINLTPNTEEG